VAHRFRFPRRERLTHQIAQGLRAERLFQIGGRAETLGRRARGRSRIGRHYDDDELRLPLFELLQQPQPVDVRHS